MHIESYDFGKILIDGKEYRSDVIIYNDRIDGSWWRKEGHKLAMGDREPAISGKPEILVIGTGADGVMKVTPDVISEIEAKGIKVIIRKTGDACDEYNKLAPSANVVAALHLTC